MTDRQAALRVVADFARELEAWREGRPGWTERQQVDAFPPSNLWARAAGDAGAYRALMIAAGYLVPRRSGDDGNLPCGWPGRERAGG